MYYSKKLCKHFKKSFSVFLAFAIMLSVCAVSGVSLSVSAATDSGNYYLITTANSEWQNKIVNYRIYDSSRISIKSGSVLARNGGDTYVLPSTNGVAKLEFSLASFDLPTNAVANGYSRIFFNSKGVSSKGGGSYDYSNPYVHYYEGSSASQIGTEWPGVKMTKVSSSSSVYYADIPVGFKKLNFCDWNNTDKTVHQTTDQIIAYYGNYAYFSGNRWENPRIRSIDISDTASSQDSVYMDKDENLVLSKFAYNSSGVEKRPVYVYNDNWKSQSKIYATYSLVGAVLNSSNTTYTVTVELTPEQVNGYTMFKGEIPVDTNICFRVNPDNFNGCSNVTSYTSSMTGTYSSAYDDNTATYKMINSTENWMKRSDVSSVNYDAVIGNTFANNPNIVGVDATYFDYWSDKEQDEGYLQNRSYGEGIEKYWYQFDNFNAYINTIAKRYSNSWKYPLYFGNMYNGYNKDTKGIDSGWSNVLNNHSIYLNSSKDSLTNFNSSTPYNYAVNNSNGMKWGGGDYNQSLMGLVYNKLDSNGDLQVINGLKAPYFDANTLSSDKYNGKKVASVYKASFPFRTETDENGVTKYSFTSKNATDNIYFTWDGLNPKQINYGAGDYYGVKDKLKSFGGDADGYGIFPFNTNDNTKTTNFYSKTQTSSDGEFYIRTDNNVYYLWLFNDGGSGTQKEVTEYTTVDGEKYIVVDKSVYNGYSKCVLKPNKDNWNGKSNDLTISSLVNYGAVTTSGDKYNGKVLSSYKRTGNDEVDYGFGIRLDIDFRVPENGKLSNGDDVTFNFTGDDDIWVYIGEDPTGADADLVLDLGGDHKEASGNINFATMQATVDDVFANYSTSTLSEVSVPDNEIWVRYDDCTKDFVFGVWNYGNNDPVAYIQPYNKSTAANDKYFKFRKSDLSGYTYVRFCKWQNYSDGSLSSGGMILNNMYGKRYSSVGSIYNGPDKVVTSFNNGKKLDPNKTYHMVVFYMERGESESNLSIDFTMTPANNDLTVNKSLDTADTVTEIANDLRANETYDYTITDGSDASGKGYKLNGEDATLGSNGSFTLKDAGNADFDNTFKTGSDITVNESISSPLSYTTNWELVNKKNGATIKSDSSTKSEFALKDYDDESSNALFELDYVNKIKTSSISLSKSAIDENGDPYTTDQQFDFKLLIDLDGYGSKYSPKAYPVKYILGGNTYTATQDGIISVGAGETVEIVGLPIGATYTLEEQTASGYVPVTITAGGVKQSFNGTYSGTINEGGNSLAVVNKLNPVEIGIAVGKTLDGANYTGSKFTYTLSGLPKMTTSYTDGGGNYIDSINTAQTDISISNVQNGSVSFDNLTFDKVGYYRYYVTESYSSKATNEEKAVYNLDHRIFLVEVSVTANGSSLVINEPTYYVVSADKAEEFLNDDNKNSYFKNGMTSQPTFNNTTNKASITVDKSGQADEKIADTIFALIKVSDENVFDSSDLSNIIADIENNQSRAALGGTDSNGTVTFEDLLVYQDGSGYYTKEGNSVVYKNSSDNNYVSGKQEKQVYCLFEYQPANGYNPTGVIQYYTFPINDNGTYKFDVTAGYVDGLIIMPNASGNGMNIFFVIGFVILGLGVTLVLSYMAYDKVQRKKRKARYYNKK